MTVQIICREKPGFDFHYRDLARRVADEALTEEGFPYEAEVSLLLTDGEEIREINREMRGIDDETDVLSFPMLEYDEPADFSCLEDDPDEWTDPETGEVMLGDIVISLDRVREQAEAYGHSQKREYAFLIAHSMLHLMGYDHMVPEEAAVMEEHQRRIMDALRIYR